MRVELEQPAAAAGVTVTCGPLVPLPDDQGPWVARSVRAGLAADEKLALVSDAVDATRTGWPMRLVIVRVQGASERWRAVACYAFFEHAAVATAEAPTREALEPGLIALRSARPRWRDGSIAALTDLWDVPVGASPPPGPEDAPPTAADTAFSHHLAGMAHARDGKTAEAIAEWEAAAALDPLYVDGLYNAGIAHHTLGNAAAALSCWERALTRTPRDFWLLRKIIQAHNALGRYAEAATARAVLLDVWATSNDPTVKRARSYVFHQATLDGHELHASEVLGPRDAAPVLLFEHVGHDHDHHHEHVRVRVEPTPGGGARFALERGESTTELEAIARRPPFPDLVRRVHELLLKSQT